jgi:hypothetical protein
MELAHATDTNRKSGNPDFRPRYSGGRRGAAFIEGNRGAGLTTHERLIVPSNASRVVVQTSGWCWSKSW